MKEGVVQQIGMPQEVYDEPVNLFVAKFLGTPPINVFDGQVKAGQLLIGDEAVLPVKGVADRPVTVGVRPEGFLMEGDGPFTCPLTRVEVMGRDISVVCTHAASQNPTVRAIVSAENAAHATASTVKFRLKPHKVFLFDPETGRRIPTE